MSDGIIKSGALLPFGSLAAYEGATGRGRGNGNSSARARLLAAGHDAIAMRMSEKKIDFTRPDSGNIAVLCRPSPPCRPFSGLNYNVKGGAAFLFPQPAATRRTPCCDVE